MSEVLSNQRADSSSESQPATTPPHVHVEKETQSEDTAQEHTKIEKDEREQVMASNVDELKLSPACDATATHTSLSIPLGSVVEITLNAICATSAAEIENLREFASSSKQHTRRLNICGRLELSDGTHQRSVVSAFLCKESGHCGNQSCLRFQSGNEKFTTLRFELSPDVALDPQPQLFVTFRRRGSQKLSLSIALRSLLQKLAIGISYQCHLQLFDETGHSFGQVSATFRGGLLVELENSDQTWTTVPHQVQPCLLAVKVADLQEVKDNGKEVPCLAQIWSSSTGKRQAQTISSLIWKTNATFSENGAAKTVSLQVTDAATDLLFVGIYRSSSHERNALIVLGKVCLNSLNCLFEDNNQHSEHLLRLYSEASGAKQECGSVNLLLKRSLERQDKDKDEINLLASTALGRVAYPMQNAEIKCRFVIDILELQGVSQPLKVGDLLFLRLCIAQSNWKIELPPVKVTSDGFVRIGECVSAIICWALKDRSFPVLKCSVYVQHQSQNSKRRTLSKVKLPLTSHVNSRQISKRVRTMTDSLAPALIATGSLNLCSFFFQQNVSVLANLQLDLEPAFGSNTSRVVSVLSRFQASTSLETDPNSVAGLDTSPRSVKGDICIRLLQGYGETFRKGDSTSRYYVLLSSGPDTIQSSCCPLDAEKAVTWNQQLILPIAKANPPVLHLSLYQQTIDPISFSDDNNGSGEDQLIGRLTLPMFPSIVEENHLLHLELPFGLPSALDTNKQQKKTRYYHKRGLLTLEMQFLSSDIPQFAVSTSYEVVIHQVRGTCLTITGLTRHVLIDLSLLIDRGEASEELVVGTTDVIPLSSSGVTEVHSVVDLSNPLIADTLASDANLVVIGRIRGVSGDTCGCVHFPLYRDWKLRLNHLKRPMWYPICNESNTAESNVTKDALSLSLRTCQKSNEVPHWNQRGKFHINICEAILTSGYETLSSMKLGKYGGAHVQLSSRSSDDSTTAVRYRTRQSMNINSNELWCWNNEWFVFPQEDTRSPSQEVHLSLQIGVSQHMILNGTLLLTPTIEAATLRRVDLWLPLIKETTRNDPCMSAHLHVLVVYIPTIIGTIKIELSDLIACSEPEQTLYTENVYYSCKISEKSSSPAIEADDVCENKTSKRLQQCIDTRLNNGAEIPKLVIQRIGVTKMLGEICLGTISMDVLAISELCCLKPSSTNLQTPCTWCKFIDKHDRTKTTGVAKVRLWFKPSRESVDFKRTDAGKLIASEAAETFTIWKKLFYLLDQDNSGSIDRQEFTHVFIDHLEDMVKSSDGQKLLQVLFEDDVSLESWSAPTEEQITFLFRAMDSNRDGEIEWSEYLRFLRQKQQKAPVIVEESNNTVACDAFDGRFESREELNGQDTQPTLSSAESSQKPSSSPKVHVPDCPMIQKRAASKRFSRTSSSGENLLQLQYTDHEQRRLQQQIASLESILTIERRRYAELAADRQALLRSYQQLHLKHQNESIQKQTQMKMMKQTIEHQHQHLEARETLRRNRNKASTVLQSIVRSRLEQKRYQGLKLQRATAALTIQCMVRRLKARKHFQTLQKSDCVAKQRLRAVMKLQRFLRLQMHRKERALFAKAQLVSATILQKNARRLLVRKEWWRQKSAILKLQCWCRQRLKLHPAIPFQDATLIVKTVLSKWVCRWHYLKVRVSIRKVQKWWRRVHKERFMYLSTRNAVLCIQSAWKKKRARLHLERLLKQDEDLTFVEAAICLQAAWKGRQQRLMYHRGRSETTPWLDDESAIEALVYNVVAMVEANVSV